MVIDELIVVLGLDTRKFTEGQRDAVSAFKKGKEGALDFGKSVEESGAKMADVLGIARKGALGLIGAIAGGEVASFVNHIVTMDAATGRLATTIGTSVPNLSTWQYMIKQVGGEASSANSALSTLQQTVENARQGGGMLEGGFASLLGQAGGSLTDNADTMLRKIQKYLSDQISSGKMTPPQAATFLRRVPGMNEDLVNLMLADFNKIEAAAKAAGAATDENVKAAQTLQSTWATITQSVERWGANVITLFNKASTNEATQKDVEKVGSLGMTFDRDSVMDKLDRFLWGDYNLDDAKKKLAEGLRARARGGEGAPGDRASESDREGWIRSTAAGLGMDPEVAVKVARSEGFNKYVGDTGTSFGDFQLHLSPKGDAVGDAFRKASGLDPSNPANEQEMDKFALQWAAKHGWGDFHGAARVGVGQYQGIGAGAAAASRGGGKAPSNTSTSEVHIGTLNVNAPKATDADGIAGEVGPALKRQSMIAPVNNALV